ncbi:MAG: FAD-dependent oxidoreductase [Oscillospiraceae bacterium]|jgi:NADPH-dependent 2,4-dienoyl-CoA reductase/sulfur reductase-like enzyme/rhodanese-related sulfurtransferase
MKVVIVGGAAGGATAAARIRRLDEHAEIVMIERSGYISYANCGLPYYVGGVIREKSRLTLQTSERFWNRYRVDVRTRQEVTGIDRKGKKVRVRRLETGETYEESYDKLLLSPGAKPVRPPLPGIDDPRVFSLRIVEDALAMREFIETKKPASAAVIGGGFVGLEVAENLREQGIEVTVIDMADQVLTTLDGDMASIVQTGLRKEGISLRLGCGVSGFESTEKGIRVLLGEASPVEADMAVLAIGVKPETALAREAGLELGLKGAISVDGQMRTSDPDIFAVGDAVTVKNSVTGKDAVIALAGPANREARIAADVICGRSSTYRGASGTFVIKLFGMTASATGLTEKAADAAGLDWDSVVLSPSSHAGYYPGASTMVIKVLFEKKTLRILGAQIIGSEGVDKRIDVIAAAMQAGISADRLQDLELAYAPPYSSAKDPVNMAGYMIEDVAEGLVRQYRWSDVEKLPRDGSVQLLDVRTPVEFGRGSAEGFVNIPLDELREHIGELDKSKPVYAMCQSGLRSYLACRILSQEGFRCFNLSGGYRFWSAVTEERAVSRSSTGCGADAQG